MTTSFDQIKGHALQIQRTLMEFTPEQRAVSVSEGFPSEGSRLAEAWILDTMNLLHRTVAIVALVYGLDQSWTDKIRSIFARHGLTQDEVERQGLDWDTLNDLNRHLERILRLEDALHSLFHDLASHDGPLPYTCPHACLRSAISDFFSPTDPQAQPDPAHQP